MAKKKAARHKAGRQKADGRGQGRRSHGRRRRRRPHGRSVKAFDALLAPVKGATKRNIGHVQLEVGRAGAARVKRMIYPPGFHWAVDMKPNVGTELCMHAHVGFLARGEIHIEYADGCIVEHKAPQIVAIDPGTTAGWSARSRSS